MGGAGSRLPFAVVLVDATASKVAIERFAKGGKGRSGGARLTRWSMDERPAEPHPSLRWLIEAMQNRPEPT